jgi:two-component system sensor histidine kinase UhpB
MTGSSIDETALRARALLDSAIIAGAPDGIITTDVDGRVTGMNPAAERLLGHGSDAVRGRRLVDVLLPAARRAPHADGLARALTTDWAMVLGRHLDVGIVRADGVELVVELAVTRVLADGRPHLVVHVRDAVDRRQSSEELRRSEAYLSEGQRLSHTGSWAWKLATGERYWSREMFRIYGFEPADTPPPYDAVLGRAHAADAPAVRRALEEAFQSGTELDFTTRIRVPGRGTRWVRTYGHPTHDEDGRIVEYVGTVVDVTERVRANRRLRRAIEARYEAVLAERLRIARDMHDGLLQDLSAIAMQIRAVLPHVLASPAEAAATLEGLLALAEQASRQARRAVHGMREHSGVVDLVSAVHRAAQRGTAPAGILLNVRVSGRPRPVSVPVRDAATSVVHEAVTNVVKHAAARRVTVRLSFTERGLRLSVRDDGRGLPAPEHAEGREHFGLLGMRERAAEVGATLTVSSAPGRGARITLAVPFAPTGRPRPR